MSNLQPKDFTTFFEEVHGYPPFPWQQRLVDHIAATARWPKLLDLPTGVGKTSALDVALFTFALNPAALPRRIVLVVDRRVVVDQVGEHAEKIKQRLNEAHPESVAQQVAMALRASFGGDTDLDPLHIAVLRGGMPQENAWAKTPDQPLLAASTVDQIGSRLLFRGYGVSRTMAPIHAGLLGNDTLILLDEVHLAGPFSETLAAVAHWRKVSDTHLQTRWQVVTMSATPGDDDISGDVFSLAEDDRDNSVLVQRLSAHKVASLYEIKSSANATEDTANQRTAEECVARARAFVKQGAKTVAIVVNRVDTARRARALLESDDETMDAALLTGRMRSLDRDALLSEWTDRIRSGRAEVADARPLVVCATQCIEAGADFDFDALVTECASLDALRQRFGRLDRLGKRGATRASIVVRSDQLGEKATDPVYGVALRNTGRWLKDQPAVDFGIDHLQLPDNIRAYLKQPDHAPVMLPGHLDAWVRTSPAPAPDPDVSLWLHGPKTTVSDVQVVWRADIDDESHDPNQWHVAYRVAQHGTDRRTRMKFRDDELREMIGTAPPGSQEAISLPIHVVRAWLTHDTAPSFSDVEGEETEETREKPDSEPRRRDRWVVRWRGNESDDTGIIPPNDVRPGDTIVVPARFGGIRYGNFDPTSDEPVSDIGDFVQWQQRGRAVLRLHPRVLAFGFQTGSVAVPQVDDRTDVGQVLEFVDGLSVNPAKELHSYDADGLLRALKAYSASRPPRVVPSPHTRTWTVLGKKRRASGDVTTEGESGTFTATEVPLLEHLGSVGDKAHKFAQALRLPERLVRDLQLAGHIHDVGKADPRFQTMLVGGNRFRAATLVAPLAKSAIPMRDPAARREARKKAGYPSDGRHELVSVAMIQGHSELRRRASDWDLVLHLVASHHGWCRPFPPAAQDEAVPVHLALADGTELDGSTQHELARLDSGVAERFFALVRKYGWWGLAWLETILRLADHRVSEKEQENG